MKSKNFVFSICQLLPFRTILGNDWIKLHDLVILTI